MLHLATDPTWDTPDNSGPVLQAVCLIVLALTVLAGIIALIMLATKRRDAAAISGVIAIVIIVMGGVIALGWWGISRSYADDDHDHVVASWLDMSYGAKVDEAHFYLGRDTIQEATATIDGKPAIIKLARTADGHIAVFSSDDKPLPKRH